jgi:hypothetical protein
MYCDLVLFGSLAPEPLGRRVLLLFSLALWSLTPTFSGVWLQNRWAGAFSSSLCLAPFAAGLTHKQNMVIIYYYVVLPLIHWESDSL